MSTTTQEWGSHFTWPQRSFSSCHFQRTADAPHHVSIRAPARGATRSKLVNVRSRLFQSPPPHGGRPATLMSACIFSEFQSAPRHGGRRMSSSSRAIPTCFNPRPGTGGDMPSSRTWCRSSVSIRAPARGATRPKRSRCPARSRFNPRPRTGGDRGRSKRPDELRLAWSLREPCMVVDVTHPCKTFVSSQHLDWDVVTARANLHARTCSLGVRVGSCLRRRAGR